LPRARACASVPRSASGPKQFGDPAYRALVERECSVIVAENEMKWQGLQPAATACASVRPTRWWPGDKSKGIAVRGHNLFWQAEKWLPAWVAKEDFGAKPAAGVERLMREHVRVVAGHFGRDIGSWDVVNEAIDPADGKLRQNALTRPLGAVEQIDLAFRLAKEYAPHAQLVYNDYMRGDAGSARHRAGVLALLADLKKRGTPVHALGLQSHIGSWDDTDKGREDLAQWRRFLDEVTAMGYDLLITELDVNDRKLPADIPTRDAAVAAATRDYLDLTLSYPRLRDVICCGGWPTISAGCRPGTRRRARTSGDAALSLRCAVAGEADAGGDCGGDEGGAATHSPALNVAPAKVH
jgi:endo-1,4-beta-xylanase